MLSTTKYFVWPVIDVIPLITKVLVVAFPVPSTVKTLPSAPLWISKTLSESDAEPLLNVIAPKVEFVIISGEVELL